MLKESLRILIVEDQAVHRTLARKALSVLGSFVVHEARHAAEALATLREQGAVDVLICELPMAGMDGLELLHRAAEAHLVRAVLISGPLPSELRRGLLRLLDLLDVIYLGTLDKPVQLAHLAERLQVVGRPRPQMPMLPPLTDASLSEDDVRRAFDSDEFQPLYWPRCDVRTGRVLAADVRPYWVHPLIGLLPPECFMAQVDACGLLDELFLRMVDRALDWRQPMGSDQQLPVLGFTLWARQLRDRELVRQFQMRMRFYRSGGQGLGISVDPRGLDDSDPMLLENLVRLRLLGCELCMSEFGRDKANLDVLTRMPFSQLMLAATFMSDVMHQPRQRDVIAASIAGSKAMGLQFCVTDVRTADQHLLLLDLGCTQGQGPYFGGPLSGEQLLAALSD